MQKLILFYIINQKSTLNGKASTNYRGFFHDFQWNKVSLKWHCLVKTPIQQKYINESGSYKKN